VNRNGCGRVAGWHRLAFRIYVVSVAAVLGAGCAAFLLMRASRPALPPHGRPDEAGRWAAGRIADRWPSPPAIADELQALRRFAHLRGTVYEKNGAVVASSSPEPPAPLTAAECEALAREGAVERGACEPEHCQIAVALEGAAGSPGYLVVEREMHGPPPTAALPLALFLVGLGVAAAFLGSSIARPLDRLAAAARALGAGRLEARTGIRRRDELGTVARAFDEMADQVAGLLQSQTELVANVAHELRTPLARIRVALDLADDGDAAMARESLSEIAEDLAELERLVEDILASARMELAAHRAPTGDPPLHRARLAVGDLVSSCAERLRHRHPQRQVEVEVAPGVPDVEGDAVLLRRALDNLLDNARKYSPPQGVLRLRAAVRDGAVAIEVLDSGDGIAPEDLARLFTPFFRADRSRTRATGGVGLGLTLARRIVEAHGGTLSAESTVGVGTTMTVALPAPAAASQSAMMA
jgi:signal transduction histidine kinase